MPISEIKTLRLGWDPKNKVTTNRLTIEYLDRLETYHYLGDHDNITYGYINQP